MIEFSKRRAWGMGVGIKDAEWNIEINTGLDKHSSELPTPQNANLSLKLKRVTQIDVI